MRHIRTGINRLPHLLIRIPKRHATLDELINILDRENSVVFRLVDYARHYLERRHGKKQNVQNIGKLRHRPE